MLELNKIHRIDAITGLKRLRDESADIIIADPPYNIGKNFGNNTTHSSMPEYIDWSRAWAKEAIRVLKPSGTMFVYGFSEILAHISVNLPLEKRWLIWHYTNKSVPSLNFWQRSHESIIACWKESPLFNTDDVRGPPARSSAARKGADRTLPRDVIHIPALAGGAGMIERWFFCRDCNHVYPPSELKQHASHTIVKHPTQKPLRLSERLLLSSRPEENGLVVVPFAGSGSECISAKKLDMNFIGFEINSDYIRIAEHLLMD